MPSEEAPGPRLDPGRVGEGLEEARREAGWLGWPRPLGRREGPQYLCLGRGRLWKGSREQVRECTFEEKLGAGYALALAEEMLEKVVPGRADDAMDIAGEGGPEEEEAEETERVLAAAMAAPPSRPEVAVGADPLGLAPGSSGARREAPPSEEQSPSRRAPAGIGVRAGARAECPRKRAAS